MQPQHCGLCSALTQLLRRAMCLGTSPGSRRGSSGDDSSCYYHRHDVQLLSSSNAAAAEAEGDRDDRRGGISVERTDQNAILIRMVASTSPSPQGRASRRLSDADWLLLETLDTRRQRPLHTGRFLTMHKRRRKRLTTRGLAQDSALLDDIHHGQVQCVLERVWQWPFNAFTLDTVTGGRSLPVLCVHLFHWYGLMEHFNLDVVRIWKLFTLVEAGYHSTNPYHNSIHATDVTQAMHCFLQEEKIRTHLTPLEIMSSLIAAVTHDLDHPGVNQPFLIATSNHLAALYENTSVLENHHWRSAIGCLLESNVAEQLGPFRSELERQISSLILATDITRQQEFLTRFKRYLDQNLLDMRRPEDRHFILQIALKCADISNPCRPWDVSRKWSQKVCEEFFRQGDYERQLKLPVTSLCDRQSTSVPKIQVGFLRFVVAPLLEEWHRFLGTELSLRMVTHLRDNQARWEALVQKELAEETRTEISDADAPDAADASDDDAEPLLPVPPPPPRCPRRVGRRHSVPLSVPRPPPLARTVVRRESLPLPAGAAVPRRRRRPSGEPLSPLSSRGGSDDSESGASASPERPVSAENLLPEPSIASITTSLEASRLSSVLRGAALTRQQTFPPLQPCARLRYASAASDSSSDGGPPSPPRPALRDRPHASKREPSDLDADPDKAPKLPKLAEKENVDPQGLWRRRGSAPVGLVDSVSSGLALRGGGERFLRRGSVPIDVTRQNAATDAGGGNGRRVCKKPLRRRSSGGPEMFGGGPPLLHPATAAATAGAARRRGSLPGAAPW